MLPGLSPARDAGEADVFSDLRKYPEAEQPRSAGIHSVARDPCHFEALYVANIDSAQLDHTTSCRVNPALISTASREPRCVSLSKRRRESGRQATTPRLNTRKKTPPMSNCGVSSARWLLCETPFGSGLPTHCNPLLLINNRRISFERWAVTSVRSSSVLLVLVVSIQSSSPLSRPDRSK